MWKGKEGKEMSLAEKESNEGLGAGREGHCRTYIY